MKLFCVICFIHVSLQLKCDKSSITAPVGGEFVISCSYDTNRFLFSKKYWCRGSAHLTCEIVADSETTPKASLRLTFLDAGKRGLYVKMTGLRVEDTETYWVGIDKIYADVMTSVEVVVTEVPVSKPTLLPLSPLSGRPTCWGKAVTVRCNSGKGTDVRYEWHQRSNPEVEPVSKSQDLRLHCGLFQSDTYYYCVASNNMGQQQSDPIFVQVLVSSQSNCIFNVQIQGHLIYDCADRLSTTTSTTSSTVLPSVTSQSELMETFSVTGNYSPNSASNQNQPHLILTQTLTKFPLWYHFLRCGFLLSLLTLLLGVVWCTKRRRKLRRVRGRRKTECP